ncbi:1-(5-phosphoribosyl)-5-((5-phosphoribosylamino)methylideneamino)imidazole-4-carboxamide isomerase [Candidatus Micrarchaeota archaeon]|nr:1-(5-phosphoribosyl)-5-((5-phosphoribosylamino)methylideneamino)imidazole-4-carboxamide isomerase [Candidatus Micrarchaeota archaeon]
MKIIPAIDLLNGKCVRLIQGSLSKEIDYVIDPIKLAENYSKLGADLLHVVDLNGAFSGNMQNFQIISKLASKYNIQVGGGVRSIEIIEKLLAIGVKKVVLGTALIDNKEFANEVKRKYSNKIIAALDFRNGKITTSGWTITSDADVYVICDGIEEVLVTDITKDGMLSGPNIEMIKSVQTKTNARIIASGGVSSVEDLIGLKKAGAYAAIVGRSLLEGKLNLSNAIKAVK